LFGLSLAAAGVEDVTLVEGDPVSGDDLRANAEAFGTRVRVERCSVEAYVGRVPRRGATEVLSGPADRATVIVDPPRTGISRDALDGILHRTPSRIVYVSCDVATFARDTRRLLDSGYELGEVTGFDLFPNIAHVETVARFSRLGAG
jgi:tRNA/tmRNA/rRNA uracil-C5-methylase (TrmA/RlmC/RlmD family)